MCSIYIYIYIYIHTHAHAPTHTHTHTHVVYKHGFLTGDYLLSPIPADYKNLDK